MDNVENPCENRVNPPLFPCEIVDNPVDTVDEYFLWLCIMEFMKMHKAFFETKKTLSRRTFIPAEMDFVCM